MDGLSSGGDERYFFKPSNAFWHSSVHSKDFFSTRKKGRHLSVALEMNLFKAATFLFKLCTAFTVLVGSSSNMARTFSGLTFIPLLGHHETQEFPGRHPEHALTWIQLHVI